MTNTDKRAIAVGKILQLMILLVSVVIAVALCGCSQGRFGSNVIFEGETPLATTAGDDQPFVSLEVSCAEEKPVDSLVVLIAGQTAEGVDVSKSLTAVVGSTQKLDLEPGTYTFSFDAFLSVDGKQAYKAASSLYVFDGESSKTVKLSIVPDEEKTAEIVAADEAAKAAAEAEAAAAAQRAAEEEAAAEAAAAAQAQAAARQAQSDSGGGTVYVAASGKGSKYHSNPNCSRMKGTISMTVSKAKAAGYTPCSKCY